MADSQSDKRNTESAPANDNSSSKDEPLVKKNPGNFANNPERAREAGRKGGQNSSGNFKNSPKRAREAGRKGGQK